MSIYEQITDKNNLDKDFNPWTPKKTKQQLYSGQFKPLALTEAVELTKRLFLLFQARGISVILMGLQATASLQEPGAVVAGPFHPAF